MHWCVPFYCSDLLSDRRTPQRLKDPQLGKLPMPMLPLPPSDPGWNRTREEEKWRMLTTAQSASCPTPDLFSVTRRVMHLPIACTNTVNNPYVTFSNTTEWHNVLAIEVVELNHATAVLVVMLSVYVCLRGARKKERCPFRPPDSWCFNVQN